ncbi:ABC transporter ATP-binding protein [Leucobacter japonicus]|uniref:ABC transporter ATP-binding protein n=2 Tax=Leucobacter TaxID=55968 RepID=UPI0027BA8D2B|nr:ATP-binding cassette domain-containing protein [Leucobacter japonicus]
MNMIEFRDVVKRYPDGTVAVQALSIDIPEAQTTVFVGPSGCGKTTSLRMINRMIEPSSGSITIDGVNSADLERAKLRRGIGYVIQNAGLFPHRTVLQNIMTVPRLNGVPASRARSRALQLLELVGLPASFAGRYPSQLSGGQQQRVGVARALAAEPRVLLMDEPFSALDPVVRAELQEEFSRLGPELGTTIVFVTHDIDEAIRLGDRIAVFEPGGVLAQFASPETLLAAPATEFVAQFVGRDRGYRALSFSDFRIAHIPQVATLHLGQQGSGDSAVWAALVDAQGEFLGWVPDGRAEADAVRSRAGVLKIGDSMRVAVDAVLTSPSGTAAVLDADGRLLGGVRLDDLVEAGLGARTGVPA